MACWAVPCGSVGLWAHRAHMAHAMRVHLGGERTAGIITGRLGRTDTLGEGIGHTNVLIDQYDLTPEEAQALAAMLAVLLTDVRRRPTSDRGATR